MKNLGLMLSVLAGCAAPALAQDSVSSAPGLPGDGLECDVTGVQQRAAYVVDMVPMFGSWNTRWGIAPVMKLSSITGNFRGTGGVQFYNAGGSASGMSQTFRTQVAYPTNNYSLWTSAGGGVHPTRNSAGSIISPSGTSTQFGLVSSEFGTDASGASINNIVGGVVNFDPANPSRLYVVRNVAAVNKIPAQVGDSSQFGAGSVDSAGNVYFRVDDFNSTAANKIVGNNVFRVRTMPISGGLAGRDSSTLNLIDVLGGSDTLSTDWVARNQPITYGPPANVPNERATTLRGAVFGGNGVSGAGELYSSDLAVGFSTTTAHRATATDHRGNVSFSPARLRGANTVGTGASLVKLTAAAPTDGIAFWGVNPNGSPVNAATIGVPRGTASVTIPDPCANLQAPAGIDWDIGQGDFRNYQGSVFARGGNGNVAMGLDQAGRALIAAQVSGNQSLSGGLPTSNSPHNGIAVARFPVSNPAAATWVMAAWTNPSAAFTPAAGKAILGDNGNDGLPFTGDAGEFDGSLDLNPASATYDAPIGNLVPAFERTGGTPFGGSVSSPVIDSVGNVYFVATAALYKSGGIDYDTCLFKAVYDPANFCYRLELMLELGKTFLGANSNTRYSIRFLNLASSNSTAAPSGLWANSGSNQAWNNMDPSGLSTTDAMTLGGLVLSAGITYDSDGDTTFGSAGDEQYNVLLYISNMTAPVNPCSADFNGDGFVDGFDYDDFVACFEGDPCPPGQDADYNNDGFPDGFDYDEFVADFEEGCL